jgi:hypothetical protein
MGATGGSIPPATVGLVAVTSLAVISAARSAFDDRAKKEGHMQQMTRFGKAINGFVDAIIAAGLNLAVGPLSPSASKL